MAGFEEAKFQSSMISKGTTPRAVENQIPLFAHLISSPLVEEEADQLKEVPVLKYQEEREMLQRTLAESGCVIRWRSEVATHDSFVKNATESRVLHFTGHGMPEILCVEDEYGLLREVSHANLSDLFSVTESTGRSGGDSRWEAGRPELVFVSACHSETCARAFVGAGVPHAVGIKDTHPILDRASLAFTNTFYQKLLTGWTVDRAFQFAKQRVSQDSELADEADKFLLLPNPNEDSSIAPDHHARAVFQDLQMQADGGPGFKDISEPPCPSTCPAISPYFLGRSKHVYQVYHQLVNKARLVSITGPKGIGKTQVALGTAYYAQERHHFDYIVFVRMDALEPGIPFYSRLAEDFGVVRHLRGAELLEEIRAKYMPDGLFRGRVLTVLDGCQAVCQDGTAQASEFKDFVSALLDQVIGLQIILTTETKMGDLGGDIIEKVVPLTPLEREASAELFAKLMPRQLTKFELFMGQPTEFMDWPKAFGNSSIVEALEGHPMTIAKVVPYLEDLNLLVAEGQVLKIIQHVRHNIKHGKENRLNRGNSNMRHIFNDASVKEIWQQITASDEAKDDRIPSSPPGLMSNRSQLPSRIRALSRDSSVMNIGDPPSVTRVEWKKVEDFLRTYFDMKLGEAALQRPLGDAEFFFLKSSPKLWNSVEEVPISKGNTVDYNGFCHFWVWFQAQVICLSVTKDLYGITDPVKVLRPFMNAQNSESYLNRRPVGTFLVRLSESASFSYTISLVDSRNLVNHVRINVNPNTFQCETIYHGKKKYYDNLKRLILEIDELQCFLGNPDVPKHDVLS